MFSTKKAEYISMIIEKIYFKSLTIKKDWKMSVIVNKYNDLVRSLQGLRGLPLLFLRLILAYGFYTPAINKLRDVSAIGDWFASMDYPLPYLNAYLATATESLGVILLILGLGTRIISIPLMIVMIVAIFTVHIGNGFTAGNNGFEIPLYYFLMLFTLMILGPGRISLDHLLFGRKRK